MTSKCGKDKKVAHEAITECVTDVHRILILNCFLLLVKFCDIVNDYDYRSNSNEQAKSPDKRGLNG